MQIAAPTSPRPADPMNRRAWHRKASRPVTMWLVALVVLVMVHRWVPQSRWLLVHMFTLGVLTNSILVWGQHFTDALLRSAPSDRERQLQVTRVRLLNLGIVVTATGMVGMWPWVTVVGATVVGLSLCWYALSLVGQLRRSLPARFTTTVRFYVVSALMLPVGATLGGFMAFSQPEPWQGRLLLAHLFANVAGFVGTTAIGTLVTLWPTVLRTKMEPGQDRAGTRALAVMTLGTVVGIVTALTGVRIGSAVALGLLLVGLVLIGIPLVQCAVRKPPRDFPAWSIGAALLWLVGTLCWLGVRLVTGDHELASANVQDFTLPLVAGFAAQLVFGAMSYLMPTVMGGGPKVVRAACAVMNRWGALRVTVLNASLIAYLLTSDSWTRVLTSLLGFLALAAFLPLVMTMVRTSVRLRRELAAERTADAGDGAAGPAKTATDTPASVATPEANRATGASVDSATPSAAPRTTPERRPSVEPTTGRRDMVEAALGIGGVLGAVALGSRIGTSGGSRRPSHHEVTATGHTTTVDVVANADMRFVPDTVEVPLGDRLVINLTNTDQGNTHDLYLDNGVSSGRLSPGATKQVDAGIIAGPVEGWCTIVGHRAMGMVFHVTTPGATAAPTHGSGGGATARTVVDLSKPPGKGFTTRDARVPASRGRTHAIDLVVTEVEQEVAPGWTQHAMTFNGRVMGPVITAQVGDTIETKLTNQGSMGHSIDFHAGDISPDQVMRTIKPGDSLDYRFVAKRSGIWLYHCSTMPMSAHIAAGMYGAVIVPPKNLRRADREYVLVQQEMYLGPQGGHVDSAKIADERPDLTTWNGHANQYVFAPLEAKVGERVRLWVLAAGPSRGLSFHVVGGQFDTVFKEGAYLLRPDNAEAGGSQALDLMAAQGGFVELVFTEPGTYTFVNHSFVDMERGARGLIKVT